MIDEQLTGESEPQERSVFAEGDPVRPVEARNLLFK
jgi:hypothetical protein